MARSFKLSSLLFFPVCLFLALPAMAQKTIRGTVTDTATGETLPSANISIRDTYRGTISNRDGRYELIIPDSLLPATVEVRYLGFHTVTKVIRAGSPETQDFVLEPSTLELGEITVTGEDPAIRIMREVIRRKQQWRSRLETYKAEAYTRQTLANDTSIVMISESVSEAYWDKERGHREIQKSKRQTANIPASNNFAGISYLPNFYDDNVEIAGFDVAGVTNPEALKFYDFKLVDYTNIDDRPVYEIEVTPARRLQPLFEGTIYVLGEQYALLEVHLRPNDVVKFPAPVRNFDSYYEQQFSNYGQDFWLPVDMRIEGDIKIAMVGLEFPDIKFRQLSQISNYEVNVSLPDSLYREERIFRVDSAAANSDSLFAERVKAVPLSNEEEEAYSKLDSTQTLEKAFRPTGVLARFIDDEDDGGNRGRGLNLNEKIPGSLSPAVRFNRVDELYLGLRYDIGLSDKLDLSLNGGYSTGYREWGYGGELEYELFRTRRLNQTVGVEYRAQTIPQFQSRIYDPILTAIPNLLGERDYFNYYRNEGFRVYSEFDLNRSDFSVAVGFNDERHSSLAQHSAYDLLGRDQPLQLNPAIDKGLLRSVDFTIGYNLDEPYNFGVTSLKKAELQVEISDGDLLGSDFDFGRYRAGVSWSFPTFYQRRFLPNTLELNATAGTLNGELPLQKMGIIDGAIDHVSPFGSLKTRQQSPYMGEQYIMVNAEHNFRSVPFEMLGLRRLVDWNWGLILFGGAGKTWISNQRKQVIFNNTGYPVPVTDGTHIEAGISLNGLFGMFRIDFAERLDRPAFMINVSVARIF